MMSMMFKSQQRLIFFCSFYHVLCNFLEVFGVFLQFLTKGKIFPVVWGSNPVYLKADKCLKPVDCTINEMKTFEQFYC